MMCASQAEQLRDWLGEVLMAAHHQKMMTAWSMYVSNRCEPARAWHPAVT